MLDSYEIKEFVDKQNNIIYNLENLIDIILYKISYKNDKFASSLINIINTLKETSECTEVDDGVIIWDKKKVQSDVEYICKVLGVDATLFDPYFKNLGGINEKPKYTKEQIEFYKEHRCNNSGCCNLRKEGYTICTSCIYGSPRKIPEEVIDILDKGKKL